MAITVDKFLGYSSEKNGFINPAVGQLCENMIVNNGDLCNMPYTKNSYTSGRFSIFLEPLFSFYYRLNTVSAIMYNNVGLLIAHIKDTDGDYNSSVEIDMTTFMWPFSNFSITYPTAPGFIGDARFDNQMVTGNFLQASEWLLFLCQTGSLNENTFARPYMLRYKYFNDLVHRVFPLGIRSPHKVDVISTGAGNISATFDIAITLITSVDDDTVNNGTVLGRNDIESDYTVYGTITEYVNKEIQLRIWLPEDHSEPIPWGLVGIGIYTRQETQTDYYLHKYVKDITGATFDFDAVEDRWYFDYTWDDTTINQLESQAAGISPVEASSIPLVGNRNCPRPSNHGALFQNRMYYASIPADLPTDLTANIRNRLEYSQSPPLADPNLSRYINYVEGQEFVGRDDEAITGLIVFNGQLIIFKQKETWVLTADITQGSLRKLFDDKGCVNVNGGKGYIVAEGKLFFVTLEGVFMYIGGGDPIEISLPIQEELNLIDFDRFGFVRLGVDPRYNLLYVCFPTGFVGSRDSITNYKAFIFNYKDMAWTNTSISEGMSYIDVERQKDEILASENYRYAKPLVYIIRRDSFNELDLLENDGSTATTWQFQSANFTLGKPTKRKHWGYCEFAPDDFASPDISLTVNHRDTTLFTGTLQETAFHIGAHTPDVNFVLQQTTLNAFRINSFELEAHIQGRR